MFSLCSRVSSHLLKTLWQVDRFRYRLQTHCNPDQCKLVTEDQWIYNWIISLDFKIQIHLMQCCFSLYCIWGSKQTCRILAVFFFKAVVLFWKKNSHLSIVLYISLYVLVTIVAPPWYSLQWFIIVTLVRRFIFAKFCMNHLIQLGVNDGRHVYVTDTDICQHLIIV